MKSNPNDQQMINYIKNNPSLMQQIKNEFNQSPSPYLAAKSPEEMHGMPNAIPNSAVNHLNNN